MPEDDRNSKDEAKDHVWLLGVRVHRISLEGLLEKFAEFVGEKNFERPRKIMYVNVHCLNLAYFDAEYRHVLNEADIVYPNGIGIILGARICGRFPGGLLPGLGETQLRPLFLRGRASDRFSKAEWLFRLMQNPGHKWRRYLMGNAAFIFRLAKYFILQKEREDMRRAELRKQAKKERESRRKKNTEDAE